MARLVSKDCVIDIELQGEIVTLGRSSSNAICLRAPGISKVHAKIEPCDEGFRLADLDSTNGTLVNGATVRECVLHDKDIIKLGSELLLFLKDGKGLTDAEISNIFEARLAELEGRPKRGADDEFLWGTDEHAPAQKDEEEIAVAELDIESPALVKREWRPAWKKAAVEEEEEPEVEMEVAPGEIAVLGEMARVEDVRGEMLRMERALRVRRFFALTLWLMASALVHLQVVLLLRNVNLLSGAAAARRIVVMDTGFVAPLEREAIPALPPQLTELPPVSSASPEEAAVEKIAAATKEVVSLPVTDIKSIEVEGLVGSPRAPQVALGPAVIGTAPAVGSALTLITPEKPQTQEEILDDLVREMVEALRKDFLHVVLIFDESRSIDKDRQWVRGRLDAMIKELYLHLKPREVARLKWSVASFGKITHIQQTPSDNVEDTRKAIGRVPNDDSGVENPVAAIKFCMRSLHTRFATFTIMVTDERGDDTANDKLLEETIGDLKRQHFKVFFFGCEANFSTPTIKVPYREPKSGTMMQVDSDAGPESAIPEFFTPDELFFRTAVMPSGFGLYAQARISQETKGKYYFLNPGPKVYDPGRLESYAPDLCSRQDYFERRTRIVARQKILGVVQDWNKVRPENRVETRNVMTMVPFHLSKIDKALSFCSEGITALKALQFKSGEMRNMRWEAHRDLALAELYKFKFLLEEYKMGLKSLQGAPLTRNGGPLIGFQAALIPGAGTGSNAAAKKLRESTLAQFKLVLEKHAGTPWAAIAANEMKDMGVIAVQPRYMATSEERRERQPPPKPPEPPKV